ncbi:transglutaminase family protein [Ilumatobacter coccineus]|uniref:Transglutaminase-like domain-containing protein n=1 Tax=Ilumatobacter coccineus (strain NBRC 103263 / KCTC 29153 / YM16-304) TaxID=1313172 RepID=A0A6C7EB30_ILUCY|nr:transglutaminase family protein [Ilumatobacter coccineus]BAN03202.1 hypothetical protein YM304_28880 [Ilumatobacter coccineus YM16-304]
MTRYRVSHRTSYRYGLAVNDAYSVACLLPRPRPHQEVVDARVITDPVPDELDELLDVFGNRIVQIGVHHRHDAFDITATSTVDVGVQDVPDVAWSWEEVARRAAVLRGAESLAVGPYRASTSASTPVRRHDLLDALADKIFLRNRPIVEAVHALSHEIFESFVFDSTATDWATPVDTVLEQRRGVCQDFAHLAVAVLRRVGLPGSYISGYIETEPPPGQPKSIGADASHAWCSTWIPEHGWLDFDPTNDQLPPERHVTVGWGRDYADVAPVRGVVLGPSAQQIMTVAVDVSRVSPSPAAESGRSRN